MPHNLVYSSITRGTKLKCFQDPTEAKNWIFKGAWINRTGIFSRTTQDYIQSLQGLPNILKKIQIYIFHGLTTKMGFSSINQRHETGKFFRRGTKQIFLRINGLQNVHLFKKHQTRNMDFFKDQQCHTT